MTGVSNTTGLHYSWTWNISSTCALHFVHLNLFPGSKCGSSPSNPGGEGTPAPGFPCSNGDLAWPEDSQQFLESDLAAHAGPGVMVITLQHYGAEKRQAPSTARSYEAVCALPVQASTRFRTRGIMLRCVCCCCPIRHVRLSTSPPLARVATRGALGDAPPIQHPRRARRPHALRGALQL